MVGRYRHGAEGETEEGRRGLAQNKCQFGCLGRVVNGAGYKREIFGGAFPFSDQGLLKSRK